MCITRTCLLLEGTRHDFKVLFCPWCWIKYVDDTIDPGCKTDLKTYVLASAERVN